MPAGKGGGEDAVTEAWGKPMAIRVFLIDDHTIVRVGMRMILSAETDIDVVGEADNGEDGLQQVRGLKRATFAVLEEYSKTAITGWTFDVADQRTLRVGGTLSDADRATLSASPRVYDVREALDSEGATATTAPSEETVTS